MALLTGMLLLYNVILVVSEPTLIIAPIHLSIVSFLKVLMSPIQFKDISMTSTPVFSMRLTTE